MLKKTVAASFLAVAIVLGIFGSSSITRAGNFDWAALSHDNTATAEVNSGETEGTATSGKKRSNGFTKVLTAPFRALGRLFGGNKKKEQTGRINDKDARKFENSPVMRVEDATSKSAIKEPSSESDLPFGTHLEKGRSLLLAGDTNGAIGELSTAIALDPKSGEAHKLLGIAYESKGLRDRALQSFEVALRTDDNNAEHLNNLGFLLYKNGDYERATKYLKRASKVAPTSARIWNNLALTYCAREKFDDAYLSFVKAAGDFAGHMNMASQLQSHGYGKDAIVHLEKARAMRPNAVDVLQKLVALYDLTGRPTDAEAARRSLVALTTFAEAK